MQIPIGVRWTSRTSDGSKQNELLSNSYFMIEIIVL